MLVASLVQEGIVMDSYQLGTFIVEDIPLYQAQTELFYAAWANERESLLAFTQLLFAYLIATYLVASKLTKVQAWVCNVLYLFLMYGFTGEVLRAVRSKEQMKDTLELMRINLVEPGKIEQMFDQYLIVLLNAGGVYLTVAASVFFFWSLRRSPHD
jgi:hypothetical protein